MFELKNEERLYQKLFTAQKKRTTFSVENFGFMQELFRCDIHEETYQPPSLKFC